MAGFKKYEEMKKAELVQMCTLFGIEVHTKDTRQILIDKLNNKDSAPKNASVDTAPKKTGRNAASRGGTGRRRRQTAEEAREKQEKKEARKEQTGALLDEYSDIPMDDLVPTVKKKPIEGKADTSAIDRIDRELAASKVDPRHTLKGKMLGSKSTEERIIDGKRIPFVNYMVSYGPYIILIPSFKFWYNWYDQDEHPEKRLYEQGAAMEGLEIEFNMFRKEQGVTTDIYGTRLYATKIDRCENWYAKTADGEWCIGENSLQNAKIMRVRPYDIIVEVFGAEATIPIKQISHFYEEKVNTKKYKAGKEVLVRVSNIRRDPVPQDRRSIARFDYPVKFDASIRAATADPQIVNFDKYDEGDLLPATISRIVENEETGKVLYICNVNDQIVSMADLGPGAGRGVIPEVGSEVKIRIVDKNRDKHSFYSHIVNVKEPDADQVIFTVVDYGD